MKRQWNCAAMALALATMTGISPGQQTQPTTPPQTVPPQTTSPPQSTPPTSQVLFQSHGEPPSSAAPDPKRVVLPPPHADPAGPALTDRERAALTVTLYDLDARLTPAQSRLAMRARLTLRNDSDEALDHLALQISSTLMWESASEVAAGGNTRLELAQHLLDTDLDHTGKASEAIITLPEPLLPGKQITLDTFYSGTISQNSERLQRIGATEAQARDTDWDAIGPEATSLRGMGDVLWYPVAEPQLFLGEGAQLFDAVGRTKLRERAASIRLRLSVEYAGDPPAAAYFCGRRQELKPLSDAPDAPIAAGTGVARAEFAAEPLGFRMPSLFVIENAETLLAPLPAFSDAVEIHPETRSSSSSPSPRPEIQPPIASGKTGADMLAVESDDDAALSRLTDSAERVAPLLEQWLGAPPLSALTILDHLGQPFEDGPLLVAPVAALAAPSGAPALVHSLTHAWVQTGRPWMDEGLAQFLSLLWTEREKGRDAAVRQLTDLMQPLGVAEPAIAAGDATLVGQPLIDATSELYFRRKAAAVWWMLRGICGDDALQSALRTWRVREPERMTAEQDALVFEVLLEKTSGKDLHWYFADWILRDRGLPDLSIANVTPRLLPAGHGHDAGWLVAVTVRNDGPATAEIPVVVRAHELNATERLRVPGFGSATARVIIEAAPTDVLVNNGDTPELRTSSHERTLNVQSQ